MVETKDPKTNEVYALLKDKIVSLQYMPGQILIVQHLSEKHGFSRTPVREALVRLRDEGLLEDADGRKFRAKPITWKLISDIYDARKAIEMLAAQTVAETVSVSQLQDMRNIVDEMQKNYDNHNFNQYFQSDLNFHNKLIELSGNEVLKSWMDRINDQQQRIRYLTTNLHSRIEQSMPEHYHIVEKLEQRDGKGAMEMVSQHLTLARADILSQRENGSFFGIQD